VGVSSAAQQTYFSKTPKELTIDESAILVGMFKTLDCIHRYANLQGVKNHRNVVFSANAKNLK
jgi:penicillin-binding protein 1A